MNKKSSGRPRMYDSASIKLEAFRQRQESAGYLRKEVLVTKETWAQVVALAAEHEVATVDAASGLLEHGLNIFTTPSEAHVLLPAIAPRLGSKETTHGQPRANVHRSGEVSPSPATPQASGPDVNPITQFFARRKQVPDVQPPSSKSAKSSP
jgi:hypothetical protein